MVPDRRRAVALLSGLLALLPTAAAADQPSPGTAAPTTMLEHPDTTRFWLSGQANIIVQYHPAFHAAYSGSNSLKSNAEDATSYVVTLFSGYQLTDTTELLLDIESAGGTGLSDALGLAGFTDLDVVRNPSLSREPYVARAMVRQIIPLSDERVGVDRTPLSLATSLPARRIEIRAGKMGLPDFLDVNAVGSDSHLQFMNWTVDQNGAWDFAADTRGYTYAVLLEYDDHNWAARFAEGMMPTVANGIHMDWHLGVARAENVELEHRHQFLGREGAVRLLAYVNHAHMGNYREASTAFLAGRDPVPDITAHEASGRTKYGFGLNVEQALTDTLRAFGRAGWNDGANETFAFTEVDRSGLVGADLQGTSWCRENDKIGLAYSINGISDAHRQYLALGGHGFILGDGRLNYGTEQILEGYYTLHVWRGVFLAADLQYIRHPGYNRDRGPVIVPGFRFHVDV
jgi:high affinity Mn2+ porin